MTELTKDDSLASDFEKLANITIDKNDAKEVKVTFNKDVVERYYGTKNYGYTISISFDRDVASTKIAGFDPYRIKGIDQIVAVLGGSSYDDHTGGRTNFAVRDDQTAYDLATLLPSWGIEQ